MFPILSNEISNRFNEKYFQKLYDRKLQLSKIKPRQLQQKLHQLYDEWRREATEWDGWPKTEHPTVCYKLCFIQTYNRWIENYNYQKIKQKSSRVISSGW